MITSEYVSILRGKDKDNNMKILKTLAEHGPMTITDMTKSLAPRAISRYSKEFASLNPTIYRRTKALINMKYLTSTKKKEKILYELTFKAKVLAWAIWPDLGETHFIMTAPLREEIPDELGEACLLIEDGLLVEDPDLVDRLILRPFERLINFGRINLDVISDEELIENIKQEIVDGRVRIQTKGEQWSEREQERFKYLLKTEIRRLRGKIAGYEEMWRISFPDEPFP